MPNVSKPPVGSAGVEAPSGPAGVPVGVGDTDGGDGISAVGSSGDGDGDGEDAGDGEDPGCEGGGNGGDGGNAEVS